MRTRLMMIVVPCSMLVGPLVAEFSGQSATGTITGQVMVRERQNGDHSLLVTVKSPSDGVKAISLGLPAKLTFQPGYLPPDWSFAQDGKKLEAHGPAQLRLDLRFDAAAKENLVSKFAGKKVTFGLTYSGAREPSTFTQDVEVWPRVSLVSSFDDALTLPPDVTVGQPFFAVPHSAFGDGRWHIERPAPVDPWTLDRADEGDRLSQTMTDRINIQPLTDVASEGVTTFSYTDPWGEETFRGSKSFLDRLDFSVPCGSRITGGSKLTFAGQNACVTGCFPHLRDAFEFTLDGQTPLVPQAASRTTVVLKIPPDVTAGSHDILWGDAEGRLIVGVLQLQGTIDQAQLWRGQSTTMRLQIVGSSDPLPLVVMNRTPTVIDVEGGVRQVLPTPGGAVNAVTRNVRGIHRGDFQIDYSLDYPACGLDGGK